MLKFLSRTLPFFKLKPSFTFAKFCLVNKPGEKRKTPGKISQEPAHDTGKEKVAELHAEISSSNIHNKKQRVPEKNEGQLKKDQTTNQKDNQRKNDSPALKEDNQLNENTNTQVLNQETNSIKPEKQEKKEKRVKPKKIQHSNNFQKEEKKNVDSKKESKVDSEKQKRIEE